MLREMIEFELRHVTFSHAWACLRHVVIHDLYMFLPPSRSLGYYKQDGRMTASVSSDLKVEESRRSDRKRCVQETEAASVHSTETPNVTYRLYNSPFSNSLSAVEYHCAASLVTQLVYAVNRESRRSLRALQTGLGFMYVVIVLVACI